MINKIKIALYALTISMFVVGCSDDEDSATGNSSGSADASYAGTWTVTSSGTYANGDCTGSQTESFSTSGSSVTLNADGTVVSNSSLCDDPTSDSYEMMCTGTWSSTDGVITYTILFETVGTVSVENGITQMTVNTEGTMNDEPYCGYSIYALDAPSLVSYEFTNDSGQSTVSYSGQIVRDLLIRDIKSAIADGVTAAELLVFYENSDASATIAESSDYDAVQTTYHEISTSNLSGKIADVDGSGANSFPWNPADNVLGYDMTPDALMNAWFTAAETMTNQETPEGVRVDQMVAKGLLGMVAYYQGTSVYLHPDKIDGADNSGPDGDNAYTKMEHYWDESFGYFGAHRDYWTLSNDNRRGAYNTEWFNETIDYLSEYSFDWAAYAAKRDDCSGCDHDGSFGSTIMGAYLEGRAAISNGGNMTQARAYAEIIQNTWEKVVAANIVHYINDVQSGITAGTDFNKVWAEMRAFALCMQYNYNSAMTSSDLSAMITSMGNQPPTTDLTAYSATLEEIKTTIGTTFMFTDNDLANW